MGIDQQILNIDRAICRHIEQLEVLGRASASQDILKNLRDFVEHIMLKIYAQSGEPTNDWNAIKAAVKYVKTLPKWKDLARFHEFLQISVSHYTPDEESSERLMLKYYVHLLKIKDVLHERFSLEVLANLDKFPLNTDASLQEYYTKIAERINAYQNYGDLSLDKYYIRKIKPFFIKGKIYYEVTFTPANDYASKFDRVIAFTRLEVADYYAVKFAIVHDCIELLGKTMPILIITNWEVAIRDCELYNFTNLVKGEKATTTYLEQQGIARFLTSTGFNLAEIVEFSDSAFSKVKTEVTPKNKMSVFFENLERCREIILENAPGSNLLRYLLYHMNNKVIKAQYSSEANPWLSGLFVQYGSIPFDKIPFNFNPRECIPRLRDLFACIPVAGREHELLARFVRNNTEVNGQLFTPLAEAKERFGENVDNLVDAYCGALYRKHRLDCKMVIEKGHLFINEYKNDVQFIISELSQLAKNGIQNYSVAARVWLSEPNNGVDCDQKKAALTQMFESSRVALVYGSAGTGKSTLINHIAHLFGKKKKLFLAHTNPAVENMKSRVNASECKFSTITKFLNTSNSVVNYDIIVVDECSTVSNSNMRGILSRLFHENPFFSNDNMLLVLVGDTYQIDSIGFGNWFDIARKFVPHASVCELTNPWRSSDQGLLKLWERVREMDGREPNAVLEALTRQKYTANLDESIFAAVADDEIILCLNYDGLYGINNINRFLQESNSSIPVAWGIQQYKVNDPILFNESERFSPVIYNNMKGKIKGIKILDKGSINERIQFDIELDKVLMGTDVVEKEFQLLSNSSSGNSVIRFDVIKSRSADEDNPRGIPSKEDIVPFQVAYAVSIHKSQGLEYDSVKIVITDEIDELITHNIFYTAITRTRNRLKIYWTPEVEKKVLESIKPKNIGRDVSLLRDTL
ncbi:ATP-dependent DNA helicase [Anaeroarcus burkinensis]|uniref:ATP-dependent DNA helicase n=1 Tax=Anaeroarcus burkinensis TaxID=82376 RepID=UPI0004116948|nr:ATP-dependent RecD-like DNA helicase [Anaeroarcus burkinensis]